MKMMDIDSLIKLSTYARNRGVSYPYVFNLAKAGKLETVVIDGVKFVVVKKDK